jgi:hypothetical protein
MKYAIAMMLLLTSFGAFAAPAVSTLSWEAPTTRVDGTPLDPADIAEYRVYYTINGEPQGVDPIVVSGTSESETVTLELTPRVEPYVISFAITTVDTNGLESAQSETVSKTFQVDSTAAPGAPTNIQFTITCGDGCTINEIAGAVR